MPRRTSKSKAKRKKANEKRSNLRPFWSGTISFGLVSIPVEMVPAQHNRHPLSMRMLAPDGTPLSRRYFCPVHDRALSDDEIVRGYEVEQGRFVEVTDDELEQLEPEKSRDIELQSFVPCDQIAPLALERSYFLTPSTDSTRAYRLLAQTMERAERAGIASFVLRGKEHLVAIFSQDGILRGDTLRFVDELRTPEEIGLPDPVDPPRTRVTHFVRQIRSLAADQLEPDELTDADAERLRSVVEDSGSVVESKVSETERAEADVVDLMERLKQQLHQAPHRGSRAPGEALQNETREELYERARERDIPGRSKMSKDELIDALSQTAS